MRRTGAFRLAVVLSLSVLLAGCDGGWFGTPEEERIPGERISILDRAAAVAADPDLADVAPALPDARDGDWPQPYGGATHAAGHRTLSSEPKLAWSVSIGEGEDNEDRRIVYPPVVADGRIYAIDAAGRVGAWSTADGERIWRVDPTPEDEEDGGFGGGLAYRDGVLYLAAGFAQVIAFDAATGEERWRTRLPTPSRAAPAVDGGRVFAITIDNRLTALDAATGRSLWTFDAPPATATLLGGAAPAAADGAVVAAMTTGEIVAFRAANGRVTWDDSLTAVRRIGVAEAIPAVRALPVIADGQVIAVGAAGFSAAIDFATGRRLWDRDIGGMETPAVAGRFVYLLSDLRYLVALSRADGRIAWTTDLKAAAGDIDPDDANPQLRVYAGPIAAGGRLIVVRGDGHLLFFDPADGALKYRLELPGETALAPVVAGGVLYVLTEAGQLAAYR